MIEDEFAKFKPKLVLINGKKCLFDRIRKKYLIITPEEWVRQFIVEYISDKLKISSRLISLERRIKFRNNRYDISFFKSCGEPFLLMECKSPYVPLKSDTLQQVENYSYFLKTDFIGITNGLVINFWNCKTKEAVELDHIKNFLK